MIRNPSFSKNKHSKILDGRKDPCNGSKWDKKKHKPTELTYFDLRYKVGDAVVNGKWSIGRTATTFSISKAFVHKWSRIFAARKAKNLKAGRHVIGKNVFRSISNRPEKTPSPIRDAIRNAVVKARTTNPIVGSAKIRAMIRTEPSYAELCRNVSCATIDKILREEGLIIPGKKRDRNKTYGSFERPVSMDLVQIDYKKWNSDVCTIWILDDRSRFIMGWSVDDRQSAENTIELLERTFELWGVWPRQILSDHGTEFYSVRGGKGKSALDKWCLENGIEHIHGRVRHPQTQGKIERSHGTAKAETPFFGNMRTLKEAKSTVTKWVEYYNVRRPHQALNYDTPIVTFLACLHGREIFPEGCGGPDPVTRYIQGCPAEGYS